MPYNFLRYEIVEFGNWKKDCSRPFRFQISSCNLHSELYTLLLNQFLRVEDEERILKSSQLPQHTIFVPCYLDFTSCCKLIEMASFTFRSYPHSEILYLYESYTFVGRLPTCSICDIYIYIYRDFLCKTVQDLYDLGEVPCSFTQPQPTKDTLVELEYFQSFLISCWWKIIPSQKWWNWNI